MSEITVTRNGEKTNYDKMINPKKASNYDEMLEQADAIAEALATDSEELSDEQADAIIRAMDSVEDPTTDLPSNNGVIYNEDNDTSKNKESLVSGMVNPVNGAMMTIPYKAKGEITEKDLDDLLALEEEDFSKIELNIENLTSYFEENFKGVTPEGVMQFIKVINRYRAKEKFNYFKELPDFIKNELNTYVNAGGITHQADKNTINAMKNMLAKDLFDNIIFTNFQQKAFQDISEFTSQQIDKESEKLESDLSSFNSAHRKKYEVDFLEMADKIEAENPDNEEELEKAKKLREASHYFIQAYTYEEFFDTYSKGKVKVKPIMIDKFKRTCSEFNQKYYNSNLTIRDVTMVIPVLDRNLPKEYDIKTIQKFIVAFIVYTKNFKPANIPQHVFMYFFIQNILMLDVKLPDEEFNKFNEDLKNTICKFLDAIIERDNKNGK